MKFLPMLTEVTVRPEGSESATGVSCDVVLPRPSSPLLLRPQHVNEPPSINAQNALVPAWTLTGLLGPSKVTSCGVNTSFEELLPRPSCP